MAAVGKRAYCGGDWRWFSGVSTLTRVRERLLTGPIMWVKLDL